MTDFWLGVVCGGVAVLAVEGVILFVVVAGAAVSVRRRGKL